MGQALRRAAGRVRPARPEPPARKPDRPPPPPEPPAAAQDRVHASTNEALERPTENNTVLEERDPNYDDMLKHMVGRIRSRPGGKHEMGEAFIVERYNRPMPRLRSSRDEAGSTAEKPLPHGTLNAVQIHQILLLHQGKSDDHQGPMDIQDIAKKFRVEEAQIRTIVQFVSLPPEDNTKKNTE